MGKYTSFLFAQPDFLSGAARILDFGGALNVYNNSPTENIADARALHLDWKAVKADMRSAIIEIQQNQNQD